MSRGVYLIRHNPTGRCYVGGSTDIEQRWQSHRYCLGRGVHSIPDLQADWDTDGADAFTWEVAEAVPDYASRTPPYCYAIDFAEQRWVDRLLANGTPLYNRDLRFVSASRMPDEQLLAIAP